MSGICGVIRFDGEAADAGDLDRQLRALARLGPDGAHALCDGAAGLGFRDVVKAQIFLTNLKDFALVSEIRNRYFAESRPASTLLEVSKLAREGCCLEIEVIAIRLR